jgi:hypothetical protein
LTDALSRKHKFSLVLTSEQDFIPQSINPTEDNTSITINNLSISSSQKDFNMVSLDSINFKHTNCDFVKCAGREESLGHHLSYLYLDEGNDGDHGDETEDYDNIKKEEMSSDDDTLSTISEEIFEGYDPENYPHNIEQDQLNRYHYISIPADDPSLITNDDNIPSIISDIVNDA